MWYMIILKLHVIGYHYAGAIKPEMKDLRKYATPQCAPNWWEIGILLGCNVVQLDTIKVDNPLDAKRSCTKMFNLWLQCNLNASWKKFFEAYDSFVGLQSTGK